MISRLYSLRAAARLAGVTPRTLKVWLAADLAMEFGAVARGSKFLLCEEDIQRVLRARRPQSNFTRRRELIAALHERRTA